MLLSAYETAELKPRNLFQAKVKKLEGRKEEPVFVLHPRYFMGGRNISSMGEVAEYRDYKFDVCFPVGKSRPWVTELFLEIRDNAELLRDSLASEDSPKAYFVSREYSRIGVDKTYTLFVGERDVNTALSAIGTLFSSSISLEDYRKAIIKKPKILAEVIIQ